ncbi:MAG: hypothetical protein JJ895_10540 [Balneolaceae bacterium]|nr:hypothetical protein [Balneolaceae bacterium]
MTIKSHIQQIDKATRAWFRADNILLKEAIEQTVAEGLFTFEDIKFAIRALKEKVYAGQVAEWAERAGLSEEHHQKGKKVLCLHAGNLPMVGFQDALGTILSGANYYGKLSSKDPYLLAAFLDALKNAGVSTNIDYSTDLNSFKDLKADKVLFAGSEQSVEPVKLKLSELNAITDETAFDIRTAKFSIAYITSEDSDVVTDLVEAIFRYGGQGCRSVAVVVSPIKFSNLKCHFQDYIEAFWLKNPPTKKYTSAIEYQFAYNKAIERDQAWLDHFLIQDSEDFPELDSTLHWVQGDENKVKELVQKFGAAVQTVYTAGEKIAGLKTDFLSQAQTPNLWWEPDRKPVI